MTAGPIAVLLALAVVALAAAVGAIVIALAARLVERPEFTRLGPRLRSRLLVQARLAPLLLAAAVLPVTLTAFQRFEPAGRPEPVGPVLVALAVAGAVVLLTAMRRVWQSMDATRAVVTTWRGSGRPQSVAGWPGRAWVIESVFPVVAVVGVRRAELFMSAGVLEACSAEELAAIAAHEQAHVTAHDNLVRVLFASTPGLHASATVLERHWAAAAEEVADLDARASGDGVILARALTRVARLALGTTAPAPQLMSALIGGDGLEARVRRLLAPATPGAARRAGLPMAVLTLTTCALVVSALPEVYEAAEFLVRLGR